MKSSPGASGKEFRIAFCEKYRCPPDLFERRVLRRCFPIWAQPLGALVLAFKPQIFRRELSMITRLGHVESASHLRQELEGYAYENARDKSFRTESLGLRLSRRRFFRLIRKVLPDISPPDDDRHAEEPR